MEREAFGNLSNKIPLSIEDMYSHLSELTRGWPKCISGQLCYQDGTNVSPLGSHQALFAWIDRYAAVTWKRQAVTKEEFFAGLIQQAERFAWASPYPHFPRVPGVYYSTTFPDADHTGELDELVDVFSPASKTDRHLLKALVMTQFWGGPPGKRPMFVITSDATQDKQRGCGAGKTTLAEMVSSLVGGYISVRHSTNHDRAMAVLLSPGSWPKRVVLIDNLKSYKFSSEFFESLITCESINGHRLHHGYAERPNLLTWIVTVNGASFSKDLAERSVVINVERPRTTPTWASTVAAFIEGRRTEIVADIRWHLERRAHPVRNPGRWPDWEAGVLAHMPNPDYMIDALQSRRAKVDDDDQDAADMTAHFRACLANHKPAINPDTAVVRIPTLLAGRWVRMLKAGMSDRQAAQYMKQLRSPRLIYFHSNNQRGYIWTGANADPDGRVVDLKYTVEDRK